MEELILKDDVKHLKNRINNAVKDLEAFSEAVDEYFNTWEDLDKYMQDYERYDRNLPYGGGKMPHNDEQLEALKKVILAMNALIKSLWHVKRGRESLLITRYDLMLIAGIRGEEFELD